MVLERTVQRRGLGRVFVAQRQQRRGAAWAVPGSVKRILANDIPPLREARPGTYPDPMSIVGAEMGLLSANMRRLLATAHPGLGRIAKYYVQDSFGGKRLRPLIVLLMAKAVGSLGRMVDDGGGEEGLSAAAMYDNTGPITAPHSWIDEHALDPATSLSRPHRRLAEIIELIHAASLLHDDVIDGADSRRGAESGNAVFGNKMAILAGDFLLARASVALARLRNTEVVELLATAIANLVEGEFMQLKNAVKENWSTEDTFKYYIQKTYLKTGSLISKSCRSAAILGGAENTIVEAAYAFGRNLGLAFQLVDDMLDYTARDSTLGKPSGADLRLGLATAPVLFAWRKYPELGPLIYRKFSSTGDVDHARNLVDQSDGIEQTRRMASEYTNNALSALSAIPDSPARKSLEGLASSILERSR